MSSGILASADWEKLVRCERKGKDRCWACEPCRIHRHHESVVIDLTVRKNRLADAIHSLVMTYVYHREVNK